MNQHFKSIILIAFMCLFCIIGYRDSVHAGVSPEHKKEYTEVLSQLVRDGIPQKNLDAYKDVIQSEDGEDCLKKAVLDNRASLIAEKIDGNNLSWKQYYAVDKEGSHYKFVATKMVSRSTYRRRYRKVQKGLNNILGQIDDSMSDADKALAVYIYITKNTTYKASKDCHTGYDVLVKNKGVCDGIANVYALAMKSLHIPCIVVSNYSKDHSWNMIKINNKWYFCDLTIGVGRGGKHNGMVISYDSFLVSAKSFLKDHNGYKKSDIFEMDNSDDFDISSLRIAKKDYLCRNMKTAFLEKPCTFYENGYWYWISGDNIVKRSKMNGKSLQVVFRSMAGENIGWIDSYNKRMIISINDKIYSMDFTGNNQKMIYQLTGEDSTYESDSILWRIACIGRFTFTKEGRMSYYITDMERTRPGVEKLNLGKYSTYRSGTKLSRKRITLTAGYSQKLNLLNHKVVNNKKILWKSSRENIASVDKYGVVTARQNGNTVITARRSGIKVKCYVKVVGYTITYKNAFRNAAENMRMYSGNRKVILEDPYRSGYQFCGWYTDHEYTQRIYNIEKNNKKNYILYAKWKKQS